ncbi:hypothetical protein C8R44DRAFT_738172 [Mycena epipterygia]|nr:hypothetical protein C8R44DRAFT_738172 [Mycena epipterygia]
MDRGLGTRGFGDEYEACVTTKRVSVEGGGRTGSKIMNIESRMSSLRAREREGPEGMGRYDTAQTGGVVAEDARRCRREGSSDDGRDTGGRRRKTHTYHSNASTPRARWEPQRLKRNTEHNEAGGKRAEDGCDWSWVRGTGFGVHVDAIGFESDVSSRGPRGGQSEDMSVIHS